MHIAKDSIVTSGTSTGSDDAGAVRFCSFCNKPFTAATSYTRHVAYCRRAQLRPRMRRRSCRNCKASKAKCSFQPRCARCLTKNLQCIYEHDSRASLNTSSSVSPVHLTNTEPSFLLQDDSIPAPLEPFDPFPRDVSADDFALIPGLGDTNPSSLLDGVLFPPSSWDIPFDFSFNQLETVEVSSKDENTYLTRVDNPHAFARRSADLILDALYAVVEQMRRRETFPPFIHPHWHQPSLPEPLAVCMHISQMYALQTNEMRAFLWRTILAEQRRAVQRLETLNDQDLLAEMQVGMVYLIMRLVDGIFSDPDWTREMMTIQTTMCMRFYENNGRQFFTSEQDHPSATWEEWIYAESRRRTAMVWFLITSTIVVNTVNCATTETPEVLPLPAPKTQWEARTRGSWLSEMEAGTPALSTFGALMKAKKESNERSNAHMLGAWNARADSLGSLLNIATAIA
ncbi:unnamed protein product [Periconia digitata]|uniref:Zn(2)-C6 fungal-type domain-containing protein n=1 Tax=Periconia digitata TaxID=1303443 RepID=A0A9W4UH35_9PLEO|nr:unnamed protein product [Periconia digitata]